MSSNINPVKPVVEKIKKTGKLTNINISFIVKYGYKKIKEENNTNLKEILRYGELPVDIARELNRIGNLTKQQLYSTEKNKQTESSKLNQKKVMLYLKILQKGIDNEEYLTPEQVEDLKKYIDDCILQFTEDISKSTKKKEYKKEIYEESKKEIEKVGENIMKKTLRITKLYDEINDFLIDSNEAIYDDFNILEDEGQYDIYMTVDKEETFRIHSDECRYIYRILQNPVANVVYCISISSDSDLDIKVCDSMEEALSLIFEDMNNDEFINLDTIKREFLILEDSEEPSVIYFDTKDSFCEKIQKLIN
ncbi:hypothetical protein [Romboutsia sp.]|uniref:hypothetical protein n=1 Tax=Romboutsia sp. TaxID=1965302 RepID=UPI003F323108